MCVCGGGWWCSVCFESVSGLLKTALCAVSLFQVQGDLEDLESVLGDGDIRRPVGTGSCSALVKLLPGNRDLYIAQDTWNGYESMLRILKVYKFPWKTLANGTGEVAYGTGEVANGTGEIANGTGEVGNGTCEVGDGIVGNGTGEVGDGIVGNGTGEVGNGTGERHR